MSAIELAAYGYNHPCARCRRVPTFGLLGESAEYGEGGVTCPHCGCYLCYVRHLQCRLCLRRLHGGPGSAICRPCIEGLAVLTFDVAEASTDLFRDRITRHAHGTDGSIRYVQCKPNDGVLSFCAECGWEMAWTPRKDRKPGRAARSGGRLHESARKRTFCMSCGATQGLVADHLIPVSLWRPEETAAANSAMNANALCADCNAAKSNRLPSRADFVRCMAINVALIAHLPHRDENLRHLLTVLRKFDELAERQDRIGRGGR